MKKKLLIDLLQEEIDRQYGIIKSLEEDKQTLLFELSKHNYLSDPSARLNYGTLLFSVVSTKYSKNDIIKSLSDGKEYKYSGYPCAWGMVSQDSFNKSLVLYQNSTFAEIIKKGTDTEYSDSMAHIQNVRDTCKRLGVSTSELLHMDYTKELGYDKKQ